MELGPLVRIVVHTGPTEPAHSAESCLLQPAHPPASFLAVLPQFQNCSTDQLQGAAWVEELARLHCLSTRTDLAAVRAALVQHEAGGQGTCPPDFNQTWSRVPLDCRRALASLSEMSSPSFHNLFEACGIPHT